MSSREVQELKEQITDSTHSSVEGIFDYHTETGDLNNRLDFWRGGAAANYRWKPGRIFYLRGVETSYRTTGDALDEQGFNLTAGLKASLSDAVETQIEVGGTRFSTSASTLNAMGTLRYKASGGSTLHVTGSRTNVEESLLSATGIRPQVGPFAGQLVGQVMDNRIVGGGQWKLTRRFDVFGEGGVGQRTGRNIESNALRVANGGAGYSLVAGPDAASLSLVRVSYQLDYFGFDKDLFGYGGVSLTDRRGRAIPVDLIGSDGLSPAGVGGYFSPANFVSNVGRIELRGHPHRQVDYHVAGFAGIQDYTGSPRRAAEGFFGSLTLRLNERFSLPLTYVLDNFGPFTQQTFFVRLVVRI